MIKLSSLSKVPLRSINSTATRHAVQLFDPLLHSVQNNARTYMAKIIMWNHKKTHYERRVYESVDDMSISHVVSPKSTENNNSWNKGLKNSKEINLLKPFIE